MKAIVFAALFIPVVTCKSNTREVNNKDSVITNNSAGIYETLAGSWQLQPVLASDTASGKIPTLNFDPAHHKVTGNTGCNSMSGSFILKGDALKFNGQIITTKMVCQGYNEKASSII